MNTRFGLDANMAPDMFLIAVTLLVLAIRKNQCIMWRQQLPWDLHYIAMH